MRKKEEIKCILENIGTEISALLPEGIGFIFMGYEFKASEKDNTNSNVVYISNTSHNDATKLMTEFCEKINNERGDELC